MGAGRRVFSPGEVLTASNTMNYLMDQAVMSFAGTAARGSAIGTAVAEGMVSYLQDTNFLQVRDDNAWHSIAGVQAVANATVRDSVIPSPNQGDKVFRTDLGYEQTYYAAWGTANPGGRASGGWFDNQRNMGLVPIVPPTVNFSGGTATANTLGEVSFTGVTSISLNSIFSATYNSYRIIFTCSGTQLGAAVYFRYRSAGTDRSNANHYYGGSGARENGTALQWSGNAASQLDITRTIINNPYGTVAMLDIHNPFTSTTPCTANWQTWANDNSGGFGFSASGIYALNNSNDGFTMYLSGGTMTGRVTVYGYNI